jgi:hypothetical protein
VDVAALQRQVEELKSRQSGADRARADVEALLRDHLENASFMQDRLRELTEENQRLKAGGAPEPKPNAGPAEGDLKLDLQTEAFTDEEQRVFGDKTKQYVTKVIRAEVSRILDPVLARINSLSAFSGDAKKQLDDVVAATSAIAPIALRSAEKEFYHEEIERHFKDFGSRRTSPEWKTYLLTVDPVYRRPRSEVLREASLRKDGPAARKVLEDFYALHPSAGAGSGIAMEVPSSAGTGSAVGAPGPTQVPKFRYSEYTAAFKAWQRAPKNPGARQEYDKVKARYDAAVASGNVDFNS